MHGTEWRQEKEIGRGAFGIVTSWVHPVTNERIVIKQVNSQQRLDEETRRKWDNEIRLMNTMQHKNVVKGKPVPEDIKRQINNPVDLLGLEVCDRDLRKVLSQPINCCGLKEKTVLSILRDVGCGIRYLHEVEKITHRDLKPENILLNFCRNETVYKITDLGYAKRIDPQSICMSFVGTLQYLAPELYECSKLGYTYTADYWSFGTVLFECLTGERPFLLADAPFEWYKLIKNKKDEEIWGYNDEKAGPRFCTELPSQHWISAPLLNAFKGWLQLVLKQDPQKRGKNVITDASEWSGDHILDLKIIHIFNTISCSEIAFTHQEGFSGTDLKTFIEDRLNIPRKDQLLLSVNGSVLLDDTPLSEDLFQDTIYLFSKNACERYSIDLEFPSHVEESMKSPDGHHSYAWWRKTCTQSLYYCSNTAFKYKCLLRGLRALVIHIMSQKKNMLTLKESLNEPMVKLNTVVELYTTMCKADINYLKQNGSTDGLDYEKECDYVLREFQSFSKPDLLSINEKLSSLQNFNMVEIEHSEVMDKFAEKAESIYVSFLRSSDPHKKSCSSTTARDMSVVVRECRGLAAEKHDKQMQSLRCMMKQCEDIASFNSSIEKNIQSLQKKYKYVMEKQLHRQLRLLRKIGSSSPSPMSSLSSNSSSQGLECAIEKVEIVASSIELPPGIITTISNNFNRLKEMIRSNDNYSVADPPNSFGVAPLCTVNDRLPSYQFQHEDALPSFEFTSIDKREIDGGNNEMGRVSSSGLNNLQPMTDLNMLPSNTEHQFRFNERVEHGKPWGDQLPCPPNVQAVQPSRQAINLSTTPQHPGHHGASTRAVGPMLPQHAQMVMMMQPYTDTSSLSTRCESSWQQSSHPHQLDSLYGRPPSALPQRVFSSNTPRPQHAPHTSLYANKYAAASLNPNNDPEMASYNLRMQEFTNAPLSMSRVHNGNSAPQFAGADSANAPLSLNRMHPGNNLHQYNETDSSQNPQHVYQRGYFLPIYDDLISQ